MIFMQELHCNSLKDNENEVLKKKTDFQFIPIKD